MFRSISFKFDGRFFREEAVGNKSFHYICDKVFEGTVPGVFYLTDIFKFIVYSSITERFLSNILFFNSIRQFYKTVIFKRFSIINNVKFMEL